MPRRSSGSSGPATTAGDTAAEPDLAARLTAMVVSVVTLVRDKSVRPVIIAASAVVVALTVLGCVVTLIVLGALGLARLFNDLVDGHRMWATYAALGGIFFILGVLVLSIGNRATRGTS